MPSIIVDQVVKKFGKKTVVDNLSFTVNEGEIFGFLGSNGAGKSTTMNMMTGLLFPDQGRITILDLDTKKHIEKIRRQIALVPQNISLYDLLTVRENLSFFGSFYHSKSKILKQKIQDMLTIFHLEEVANIKVFTLSGGYKRRCSIACALIADPKIIFLDEPLVGIDIFTNKIVIDYFKKAKDLTIVFTTHSIKEAESFCDQILFLDRGRKLLEGTTTDIIKKYSSLLGEQVYIEFDGSVNAESIKKYLESSGFNITNLKINGNVFTFTILDLGKSVLQIMDALKQLKVKITNIDINKLSLEEVLNYVIFENEKNNRMNLPHKIF